MQNSLALTPTGKSAPELLRDAREAIDRVSGLIAGLGRLAEPPSLAAPERVEVGRLIESILGEMPEAGNVSIRRLAEPGYTEIAPADLRVALGSVLAFVNQATRGAAEPLSPIAVHLQKEKDRPCVTISHEALRLSREEREQILDPKVEVDEAGGGALRLDVGLAIASQILQRNGAELRVTPVPPEGVAFRLSFEAAS